MKILYFDCYSGVSGDMILGAIIDLGVDLKSIQSGLESLGIKGYKIKSRRVKRGMILGTKVSVLINKSSHHHKSYLQIKKMIEASQLSPAVKNRSLKIFKRLGKAEAETHGVSLSKVNFHEVGAIDSIVDIVGGVIALELLGIDRIYISPLNTGEGIVACEHGVLPIPAPATLKLLKDIPCYSSGIKNELTTPTGAAIVSTIADEFGSMPLMKINKTGYGAGDLIIKEAPNLLRVIIGEIDISDKHEELVMIESNIDDMNPELYDHVMERLFEVGAVDVFFTPIVMKKNRPASKVSVLSSKESHNSVKEVLLTETTTFGVRSYDVFREILRREILTVKTKYGNANLKIGKRNGKIVQLSPEYEDCKRIARKCKLPIKSVYEEVLRMAREKGD